MTFPEFLSDVSWTGVWALRYPVKMCIRDSNNPTGNNLDRREMEKLLDTFQGLVTVSYTHLDVYKRQAFFRITCLLSVIYTFL